MQYAIRLEEQDFIVNHALTSNLCHYAGKIWFIMPTAAPFFLKRTDNPRSRWKGYNSTAGLQFKAYIPIRERVRSITGTSPVKLT